jgi:hypothetical protein
VANPGWVKGVSGNPKGRPKKGQSFTEIMDKVLKEKVVDYNGKKISGKEAAARKLLQLGLSGDTVALKYIGDRIDGRPFVKDASKNDQRQGIEDDRSMLEQLLGGGGES